jgi:hypothetical protein
MRLRVREWKREFSVRWCVEFEISSSTYEDDAGA